MAEVAAIVVIAGGCEVFAVVVVELAVPVGATVRVGATVVVGATVLVGATFLVGATVLVEGTLAAGSGVAFGVLVGAVTVTLSAGVVVDVTVGAVGTRCARLRVVAVPIVPRAAGEDVCAFEVFTARLATTAEAFGWWEEPHAATAADAATASVIAVTRCRFRVGDVEIISSV